MEWLVKENVLTEVLTTEDIIDHFKEKGGGDVLEELAKLYIMGEQDFLYVQKPIITVEGYINFAIRAAQEIRSYNPNQIEALMYLVEYLESAEPTYSTELQNGTMITINNKKPCTEEKLLTNLVPKS